MAADNGVAPAPGTPLARVNGVAAGGPLLAVEDVSTGYIKGVKTIDRCSLSVEAGTIVGILGANNAGKTTLIRALTGSLPVWDGTVRFAGNDITNEPVERIARLGVGVALEGRRIFGSLTVEENLLLPVSSKGNAGKSGRKQLLTEIYEVMPDLWRLRHSAGTALSGGQQQMLAIGRALMVEPRLLVLDEPSLGLSPLFTEHVVSLLRSINDRYGMTILLAEQLVWIASEVSSRIYVMESGRLSDVRNRGEWNDHDLSEAYLGGPAAAGGAGPR